MIETLGYEVITANDGIEAVEVYKAAHPVLTLMDIKMPKLDGYGAFFKIKEFDPNAKIVLITAYTLDEKKHLKAQSMSLLDTIEKPYDIETLEKIISKFVDL